MTDQQKIASLHAHVQRLQEKLAKAGMCPYCNEYQGLGHVQYQSPNVQGDNCLQQAMCSDCGAVWNEVYAFTGIVLCQAGEHKEDGPCEST